MLSVKPTASDVGKEDKEKPLSKAVVLNIFDR